MNSSTRNFILVSFLSIIISRLIPHPPNFTSTIAIAFYVPALFGIKFIIVAITAFIISDLFIGTHQLILFTWGSLLLIGLLSKYFNKKFYRILGVSFSCLVFFLISNFGVWLLGDLYTKNLAGIFSCYAMGLPFLLNSLIGTLVLSVMFEYTISLNTTKQFIKKVNIGFN